MHVLIEAILGIVGYIIYLMITVVWSFCVLCVVLLIICMIPFILGYAALSCVVGWFFSLGDTTD